MNFNSIQYGLFLLAVCGVYWAMARPAWRRPRLWFLLIAGYFFYANWNWKYLGLILAVTIVSFAGGLLMEAFATSDKPARKRNALIAAIVILLALLALFKYFNFFAANVNRLLAALELNAVAPTLTLLLPVGISFYTFQALSYLLDVYRGKVAATRSFRDFALYLSFFPHLVAGPIVRTDVLLAQIQREPTFDRDRVTRGLYQVLCGLFKKVVIADVLAKALVEPAFAAPANASLPLSWLAMYGYALQIYCDFSGYSDVAIGSARLLGIEIPKNFDRPYLAENLRDFWRRWHISLSSWLRDYLYVSLGGSRRGRARLYLALFLTMLLGGLWHGAAWTFVVWGAYHGALLMLNRLLQERKADSPIPLRVSAPRLFAKRFLTFHLVCLGWIIFRSTSLPAAGLFCSRLVAGTLSFSNVPAHGVAILLVGFLLHFSPPLLRDRLGNLFLRLPLPVQGLALALILALVNLMKSVSTPFIYFQF